MFLDFIRFDGTRNLNRTTEKEEFFGQSGLARIGVTDDAEGAAAFYFF